MTLSGATTPGNSGPESDDNEGVPHISKNFNTGASYCFTCLFVCVSCHINRYRFLMSNPVYTYILIIYELKTHFVDNIFERTRALFVQF